MTFLVRFATPEDGAACARIYAPHVRSEATSFEVEPPDASEMASRITALQRSHTWLVAEADAEIIGYCYGSPHRVRPGYRWSVEVSVYVCPERHRGRVGRGLYSALFDVLERQGFVNMYAGITLPNPASVAFHEAMGFTWLGVYAKVGFKFGRWHDVAWYSRCLGEYPGIPAEPVSTEQLRASHRLPGYLDHRPAALG